MISAILIFISVGILGGLTSGLLGLGGGIIIVPLLSIAFNWLGLPSQYIYHMAVATSMSCILFSSIFSAKAHNKKNPLRWDLIKILAPVLILGALAGSHIATCINSIYLKIFFAIFLFSLAIRMLLNLHFPICKTKLPEPILAGIGICIGIICSLVGIGGGTLIVPFLNCQGVSLHKAIGVSATLGFFIALAGSLGYIISNLYQMDIPSTLGYIHLPALLCIAPSSILTAPYGVKLAYKLKAKTLKIIFGFTMLLLGSGMLLDIAKQLNLFAKI